MIQILTDKEMLNKELIYNFLADAYWSRSRTKHEIDISIDNSICFGVYKQGRQIGFARVISDHSVFAYMMDVFIIEAEQGKDYGKSLIQFILDYPPLKLYQFNFGMPH